MSTLLASPPLYLFPRERIDPSISTIIYSKQFIQYIFHYISQRILSARLLQMENELPKHVVHTILYRCIQYGDLDNEFQEDLQLSKVKVLMYYIFEKCAFRQAIDTSCGKWCTPFSLTNRKAKQNNFHRQIDAVGSRSHAPHNAHNMYENSCAVDRKDNRVCATFRWKSRKQSI